MRNNERSNVATQHSIAAIVAQHAEESAFLSVQRNSYVAASHIGLRELARHDERIAAHLDGLRIAAAAGWDAAQQQLAAGGSGEIFSAAVLAIEARHPTLWMPLLALGEALPAAQSGLTAAFGWVSSQFLQGTIKTLLNADAPFYRLIGIGCCASHRVDPGAALNAALSAENLPLRSRALKAAGQLGRRDLLPAALALLHDRDDDIRFWAAWSCTLLGDTINIKSVLSDFAAMPNRYQLRALALLLKILSIDDAHSLLQTLAQNPLNQRALISGASMVGDVFYIPWLIKQMADLKLARLAGESFSLITGLDLAYVNMKRAAPADVDDEAFDNDSGAIAADSNLPWPDPDKIDLWWQKNSARFERGSRYFCGELVTRAHCIHILRRGLQRQRRAAADYLCLLEPGSPLFPIAAPAWRQQRLLAQLG